MTQTITVNLREIADGIARTTGYAGAKAVHADGHAYERLSTNDGDLPMLRSFWLECRDQLCSAMRRHIAAEGMEGDFYRMDLSLSRAFDTALLDSLRRGVCNFFVHGIVARWMSLAGDTAAGSYFSSASAMLDDVTRKAMCKKAPARPPRAPRA